MSKPVKNLMMQAYQQLFSELDSGVLIDLRGVSANDNNTLRWGLAEHDIHITVVKNSLAARALSGTAMENLSDLLQGPCALVYGGESVVNVARELVARAKQIENLEFKGALMEGQTFGPDEVERLSTYPTRQEAQATVIQLVLGPAAQVIAAATSGGSQIAGILETIIERLEKGETISKAA